MNQTVVTAFVAFLFALLTGAASAGTKVFSERELWGIALSPDGTHLAIASTASEKGDDPLVLLSTNEDFTTYRKLALPEGLVWMDPSFSPDGSQLALAGSCLAEDRCGAEEFGWSIWTFDLETDQAEKIVAPMPGFIRWKPIFAEDGGIAWINLSDLGSLLKSTSIGRTFISHIAADGTEAIFPPDIEIKEDRRRAGKLRFVARGVAFRCRRLLSYHTDRIRASCGMRSQYEPEFYSRFKFQPTYFSEDPRLQHLNQFLHDTYEGKNKSIGISARRTGAKLVEITPEAVTVYRDQHARMLVDDPYGGTYNMVRKKISDAVAIEGGSAILFAAVKYGVLRETLWVYRGGRTEKLFELPGGAQSLKALAASDDGQMIAFTSAAFLDLNEGGRVNRPAHEGAIMLWRDGTFSAIDRINIEE